MPASFAPRHGALIANTDAFKMGDESIRWFIDLLRLIFEHGLSIQLLGDNQDPLDECSDIVVHSLEVYGRSYLLGLAQSNYRLGLIPVEHSSYADCKSAIKALDFVSQRIPTVPSDIAPYRGFAGRHGMKHFCVVPNAFEAWKQADQDGHLCRSPKRNARTERRSTPCSRQPETPSLSSGWLLSSSFATVCPTPRRCGESPGSSAPTDLLIGGSNQSSSRSKVGYKSYSEFR